MSHQIPTTDKVYCELLYYEVCGYKSNGDAITDIMEYIKSLDDDLLYLLCLRYRCVMTYADIAKRLECSITWINKQLKKAHKLIQEPAQMRMLSSRALYSYNEDRKLRELATQNYINKMSSDVTDTVYDSTVRKCTLTLLKHNIEEPGVPINMLRLSNRTYNTLSKYNITSVAALLNMSYSDIEHLNGMGDAGAIEILTKMSDIGFIHWPSVTIDGTSILSDISKLEFTELLNKL